MDYQKRVINNTLQNKKTKVLPSDKRAIKVEKFKKMFLNIKK